MKKWVFVLVLVLGALVLGYKRIKPLEVSYIFNTPGKTARDKSPETQEIVNQVKDITGKATGKYAFWVWRYADNASYGWQEDAEMPLASMMKVPIMAATLKAVDEGKLSLDDQYVIKPADVRDGSSFGAGDTLDVRRMLLETGKNSDNITPVALVNMVGEDAVKAMLEDLGMESQTWETKEATAVEIGGMWKNLYEKNVLSPESRTLLWSDLSDSIYEDRIAKGITEGNVLLVHKVGTDLDVWADSGIIFDNNNIPVAIMVIMNGGVNRDESEQLVPEIARTLWNFEKLKYPTANPS